MLPWKHVFGQYILEIVRNMFRNARRKSEAANSVRIERGSRKDLYSLPALESIALSIIIEDAVDQIIVLGSATTISEVPNIEFEIKSLKERAEEYAKNDPVYNTVNGELYSHTITKMVYLKMHHDRVFFSNILSQTKDELCDENSFTALINFLRKWTASEEQENTLVLDESKNKITAANLRNAVRRKVEENRDALQRINEKIAKCKDDIETILFDNALKLRYIENWENARIEQGFMTCDQNESELVETINKYKNEIEKEIRVNVEIESYISENQKDLEEGIENWMKRYDTGLEERQMQIQMYKDKREEQQKRYESMLAIYDEHAAAIEDFLDYKEKKRLQEELDAKREAASIKIQAWWRGLMVRLQLGPFNPNPPKGKKGKKGKNKPKKKK